MSILLFLVFGFVVGLLARAVMPGRQNMSVVMTTVIGAVGSFLGGLIGNMIAGNPVGEVHTAGWIGSIVGALIVLAVVMSMGRHRFSH